MSLINYVEIVLCLYQTLFGFVIQFKLWPFTEVRSQKIKDEINRAMSFAPRYPGFASHTPSFVENHRESVEKKKTLIPKVHEAIFVN